MDSEQLMYIIGVGSSADWERGRGSLYWIEDKSGEHVLPVFTTPEKVKRHIEANFDRPESHMQMMEGLPLRNVGPLTEGRFIIMPVSYETLARTALEQGIDYLVRDPRPGAQQEVLRITAE
jgi:hypothetical protein